MYKAGPLTHSVRVCWAVLKCWLLAWVLVFGVYQPYLVQTYVKDMLSPSRPVPRKINRISSQIATDLFHFFADLLRGIDEGRILSCNTCNTGCLRNKEATKTGRQQTLNMNSSQKKIVCLATLRITPEFPLFPSQNQNHNQPQICTTTNLLSPTPTKLRLRVHENAGRHLFQEHRVLRGLGLPGTQLYEHIIYRYTCYVLIVNVYTHSSTHTHTHIQIHTFLHTYHKTTKYNHHLPKHIQNNDIT